MFAWQTQCLSNEKLIKEKYNLIYSAPTSAGKTLVAEILAIKTVIERHKKVLLILPFVSVVREKTFYLQDILGTSGVRVEGFMGSYNPPGGFPAVQVAVCTIEKANTIINRLLEDGNLEDIGAVIVDEIHLLGDPNRGYLLELTLTKLRYMSKRLDNVSIQIIGMSATLPNLEILGKWLDAEIYVTDFRPIPLHEQCLMGNEIYNKHLQLQRTIMSPPELGTDTDHILYLCLETIKDSCSVLIFCPTKNWCESLSEQIALAFWKLGCSKNEFGLILREQLQTDLIKELLGHLKQCPSGLDKILEKTISFGVAFHHAGLTMDEREIIEAAFKNATLRVLVATSTLSSGVNLPARRVIIRTPLFHGKPLDNLVYHQMIGRAGRMGRDTSGESILICQQNNNRIGKELISSELKPIRSCLDSSGIFKRALLEVVSSGVVSSPEDVQHFSNCTLFAASEEDSETSLGNPVNEAIDFLCSNEFIRLQELEDGTLKYIPTALGKACLASSMSPEEGLSIFLELEKARQCFVLETELHLIYVVTPYSTCNQWTSMDWMLFLDLWEKLPATMKRVGELVGIRESYIINATRQKMLTNTPKLYRKLLVHKRFFTALALQDLVNEIPITDVAMKFGCSRGMLQSLQQSASSFAGMLTTFSRQLGWSSMEVLIAQFQDRLQFGVSRDLLDLMRVPIISGPRARMFYNAGIETLVHLASSDPVFIENLLHKTGPFESKKARDDETEYDIIKRNKMKCVWVMGKDGLTARDASITFIEEARRYLKLELGLVDAKWEQSFTNDDNATDNNEYINISTSKDDKDSCNHLPNTVNEELLECATSDLQEKSQPQNKNDNNKLEDAFFETSDQSLFDVSFEYVSMFNSLNNKERTSGVIPVEHTNGFTSHVVPTSNYKENDFIDSSQSISDSIICSKDHSLKRFSLPLQIKHERTYQYLNNCDESQEISNTKKRKIMQEKSPNYGITDSTNLKVVGDFTSVQIVDVCSNKVLYESFEKELLAQKTVSLSFACKKHIVQKTPIGNNVIYQETNNDENSLTRFVHNDVHAVGVAFSWGENVAFYCSFENEAVISNVDKIGLLRKLFTNGSLSVKFFDGKAQMKVAKQCLGINFEGTGEDSKVADWLLSPDGKEKNLQAMVVKYIPEASKLLKLVGHCKGVCSIGLDMYSTTEPEIRATVESVVCWHLGDAIRRDLMNEYPKLIEIYRIEMKTLLCITKMELNGIKVDISQLQALVDLLKKECEELQKEAFSHAGRRFSFTSPTEVAKILGLYQGRRASSTSKRSLQRHIHPISNIILQWRKLNSTMTKMIYPLVRLVEDSRIFGNCVIHTSTGRITMHEPNLQNVPRDFTVTIPNTNFNKNVSCRAVFIPTENYIFLSADFCQLELRILTHFSQDPTLTEIMNMDKDVFKMIAAHWKGINEAEVDDDIRQWTKQLCYGIIYGMGNKALAEHMSITEDEAKTFIESFKNQYPNLQTFIQSTVTKCKEQGYVETYAGRRRYLPLINSENGTVRAQAERQAVNTTIQGSAADIAKLAMTNTERRFQQKYRQSKNLPKLVLHLHDELLYEVHEKYLLKTAKILKQTMEEVVALSIPLPVKLKSGRSWGAMKELML
ncbi:hypothetical protein RI129_001811 [Pyrocoelia pectoralis]|uniref:DNA polymerase theta n=1 Tax=Pyrocoelia pectoralis TaxID=417401 RepID=A0AAN7ZQ10_9COLE